jgi:hypothetical protein
VGEGKWGRWVVDYGEYWGFEGGLKGGFKKKGEFGY